MKAIPFSKEKFNYLIYRQKGLCACGCGKQLKKYSIFGGNLNHILKDTKGNRQNFPLLINSLLNLEAVNNECNCGMTKGKLSKISYFRSHWIEKFLERHPKICKLVNWRCKNDRDTW